jgi:energy-coupling factor transport system permease protein
VNPYPLVRLFAAAGAIVATQVALDGIVLTLVWLCVALPLVCCAGVIRRHAKFVGVFLLPFSIALFVVWVMLVGTPPAAHTSYGPWPAMEYALRISARLALIAAIIQLCLLTIAPERLQTVLSQWWVRGDALVISIATVSLLPELQRRADQVMAARLARGYVARRSVVQIVAQLPALMRPLFTWVLRSSVERTAVWRQRRLISRMHELASAHTQWSMADSIMWALTSLAWVGIALVSHKHPAALSTFVAAHI